MDRREWQSALITSLKPGAWTARPSTRNLYCARGEMENRIKETQGDLFADRTSAATMRANQLRLWFASMAYVPCCGGRMRIIEVFSPAACHAPAPRRPPP